jgi:hypothetical protein
MSPSLPAASAVPWLVAGWIATVVVIAVLIYLISREVLRKTDPQNLPEVLRALTPLLNVIVRALAKLPIGSPTDKQLPDGQNGSPPDGQARDTPIESGEEAS